MEEGGEGRGGDKKKEPGNIKSHITTTLGIDTKGYSDDSEKLQKKNWLAIMQMLEKEK